MQETIKELIDDILNVDSSASYINKKKKELLSLGTTDRKRKMIALLLLDKCLKLKTHVRKLQEDSAINVEEYSKEKLSAPYNVSSNDINRKPNLTHCCKMISCMCTNY